MFGENGTSYSPPSTLKICGTCKGATTILPVSYSLNCGKTEGNSYLTCGRNEDLSTICGK